MTVFEGSQLKIQRRQREFFLLLLNRIPKSFTNSWANCKGPTRADCAKSSPTQSGPIPEKRRVIPELFRWREAETDEFTRRAIEGALADVDQTSAREGRVENVAGPSEVGDVYRYVASRLRHRLRNTMLSAQAQASRLRKVISVDLGPDVQTVIAKLNDAMISMGRELEATDVDPEFFRERSVALADWLQQMNVRYTTQYAAINLRLINADGQPVRVFANDYLLETVFWNIWLNAHQATGPNAAHNRFHGER